MTTDKKEATQKIAAILKQINELFAEAETIADEAGVGISWSGPEYAMGGDYAEGQWNASSMSC